MTRSLVAGACGLMMSILLPATSLFAQAPVIDQQAPIPFEGGQFTITQQEPDGE